MAADTETNLLFPPPPPVTLPVDGEERVFPVRRVYCVGRNYAEHSREMGGDPSKEAPFFFQKNSDNLVPPPGDFPYPTQSSEVHHEVELMVALHRGGADIPVQHALDHVYAYGVAVDFTRRDLQAIAKKAGRPWELAKAFENSAPCSALVPAARIGHPASGTIWLDVNGVRRQTGDLKDMVSNVAEIIAALSALFVLAPGDVILTGTPAGVGPVQRGDSLECGVDGVGTRRLTII